MARFAVSDEDGSRRGLALLYGMNTLGAVAGAGLGTFFLFERFGNHTTLYIACVLNAGVAGIAWLMSRGEITPESRPAAAARSFASDGRAFASGPPRLRRYGFRLSSDGIGLVPNAQSNLRRNGVHVWSHPGRGSPRHWHRRSDVFVCWREAAPHPQWFRLHLRSGSAFRDHPVRARRPAGGPAMLLQPLEKFGFYGSVLGWFVLCSIIVLPAAIIAGIQFPMLLALLGRGRDGIGTQTGAAYAWNTAGAIAGSLAGGFGFIPIFTATGTWRLVAILLVICAFLAAIIGTRGAGQATACTSFRSYQHRCRSGLDLLYRPDRSLASQPVESAPGARSHA